MATPRLARAASNNNIPNVSLKKILIWSFSASSQARVNERQELGPRPRGTCGGRAKGAGVGPLVSAPARTAFLLTPGGRTGTGATEGPGASAPLLGSWGGVSAGEGEQEIPVTAPTPRLPAPLLVGRFGK